VVENLHHRDTGFRSGGAANFAAPLSSDRRHRLATAILGRGHRYQAIGGTAWRRRYSVGDTPKAT